MNMSSDVPFQPFSVGNFSNKLKIVLFVCDKVDSQKSMEINYSDMNCVLDVSILVRCCMRPALHLVHTVHVILA